MNGANCKTCWESTEFWTEDTECGRARYCFCKVYGEIPMAEVSEWGCDSYSRETED